MSARGFTLVEVMVATAVAGLAAAIMSMTLIRQQRFHSTASENLDTRAQLRDAGDVLAAEIRSAAVSTLGVPLMTDSAIEIYSSIMTSFACAAPGGNTIGLPPARLNEGLALTSVLSMPDSGDLALIYGAPYAKSDSGDWEVHRVSRVDDRAVSSSCPSSTGFTTSADEVAGARGYVITLASVPGAFIRAGAPVHVVRRSRYSLYRSADRRWYLGHRRCGGAPPFACGAIQPVSGPYLPFTQSPGQSGISFRYFDEAGMPVLQATQSARVARVDLVIRAATSRASALNGEKSDVYRDSVILSVSPRNRSR